MVVRNVESDIATQIAANVAALTLGTNCFYGPVRPISAKDGIPGQAVFAAIVAPSAQPIPMRGTDAGTGPDQIRAHRVQIMIRSKHEDYAGGVALARSVRDGICYRPPSGYDDIEPVQSAPLYLGKDDKGHHEWSLNIDALTEETTS